MHYRRLKLSELNNSLNPIPHLPVTLPESYSMTFITDLEQQWPRHSITWTMLNYKEFTIYSTHPVYMLHGERQEKYHCEANTVGNGRNIHYYSLLLKGLCPHQYFGWWGTVSNLSFSCSHQHFLRQEIHFVKQQASVVALQSRQWLQESLSLTKRQSRLSAHMKSREKILNTLMVAPALIFPLVSSHNPPASKAKAGCCSGKIHTICLGGKKKKSVNDLYGLAAVFIIWNKKKI